MATSHYCQGKWRDGPVAACPKHKRLSKKQMSVFRTTDDGGESSSSSSSDSSSSLSDS